MRINLKPLSVNKAWQGKRFKTKDYKLFERNMLLLLPNDIKVGNSNLLVELTYGFSSKLSDVDNPTKMVLDCLCKKYGFDDRQIYQLIQNKEIVKKGYEFIDFKISKFDN